MINSHVINVSSKLVFVTPNLNDEDIPITYPIHTKSVKMRVNVLVLQSITIERMDNKNTGCPTWLYTVRYISFTPMSTTKHPKTTKTMIWTDMISFAYLTHI